MLVRSIRLESGGPRGLAGSIPASSVRRSPSSAVEREAYILCLSGVRIPRGALEPGP